MESASIALGAHAHEEHHGPPEANQSSKIDRQTLGILLFIVSEAMLFGAFFASYFFIRAVANDGGPWPPDGFELPVAVAGINTAILISSSFTVHWALEGVRRGNRFALKAGLGMTWLLGLTFLFIQLNEYVHLGFSARDDAFASIFYGLTGLHGAHVFVGLMLLTFANIRAWRGHLRPKARRPPRRRGAGHLLALCRRHVDHRLHDGLRPLAASSVYGTPGRRRERRASFSSDFPSMLLGKSMRLPAGHPHPLRSDEARPGARSPGRAFVFSPVGRLGERPGGALCGGRGLGGGARRLAFAAARRTLDLVGVAQRPADPLDEQSAGGFRLDVGDVDPLTVYLGPAALAGTLSGDDDLRHLGSPSHLSFLSDRVHDYHRV